MLCGLWCVPCNAVTDQKDGDNDNSAHEAEEAVGMDEKDFSLDN